MPITLRKPKGTSKSNTKVKPTAKRGPGRPKGSKNKTSKNGRTSTKGRTVANGQRKRPVQRSGIKQSDLNRHVKTLERDGKKVDRLNEELEDAINERMENVVEALNDGVGITMVSDATGVSRQNLYKALSNRGYNSDGSKGKRGKSKSSGQRKASAKAKTNGKPASTGKRGPGRPKGSKNKPKAGSERRAKISLKR